MATPSNEKVKIDQHFPEKNTSLEGKLKDEYVHDLDLTDASQADDLYRQAELISDEEAEEVIREVLEEHRYDPTYPTQIIEVAIRFLEDPTLKDDPVLYARTLKEVKMEAALIINDSPYVEVRGNVPNTDDPTILVNTARAWTIGLFLALTGGLINQFFSLRQPRIEIDEIVAQLLAYPLGKAWEKVMPSHVFSTFGYEWSLNPGAFTRKEHMLITVMANVSFNVGYSAYVIVVQRVPHFFNQDWAKDFGYQICLSLSFQLVGYGLAGLTRRFLVYPAAAIWPRNLAAIALNNSFHTTVNNKANGWKVSQMRFFLYSFGSMFVYFWFPNYIAQFLSYFSWISWIKKDSITLAAVTGVNTGLGINPWPTFDWNVVQATIYPLISPFFATANNFLGMLISAPIVLAIWFTNTWYTGYLPINSNRPFDRMGKRYNVSLAVDDTGFFDQEEYNKYSPLYLSASNSFLYGAFFAIYPATLVYAYLYHRHEIKRGFKSLLTRRNPKLAHRDIHNRLMGAYEEVPEWWYIGILAVAIGLGIVAIEAYPTHSNVSPLFFGIALALVFVLPIGVIFSVTNVEVTLNVFAEFIGGLAYPGSALQMNYFKSWGYVTTSRALRFASDLKLGHYSKIPPKLMFTAQTVATIFSTLVAVSIMNWQVNEIRDVCLPTAQAKFTCPGTTTFFTASVIWGTLGPIKMYGPGAIYNVLLWGFLIGAVLPIPVYFLARRYPRSKLIRGIHIPVFIGGMLNWAPYNLSHAWPAVIVGWFFMVFLRKRYLPWWVKYNYVFTSALDCGVAIAAIATFFALQWQDVEVPWWGNDVVSDGCDGTGCPRLPIPKGGFGPAPGEFS